jgi:hypothetical protein
MTGSRRILAQTSFTFTESGPLYRNHSPSALQRGLSVRLTLPFQTRRFRAFVTHQDAAIKPSCPSGHHDSHGCTNGSQTRGHSVSLSYLFDGHETDAMHIHGVSATRLANRQHACIRLQPQDPVRQPRHHQQHLGYPPAASQQCVGDCRPRRSHGKSRGRVDAERE